MLYLHFFLFMLRHILGPGFLTSQFLTHQPIKEQNEFKFYVSFVVFFVGLAAPVARRLARIARRP